MSHQCPFPVRSTDSRRSYRDGNATGFTLVLALVAVIGGYAGLADAAPPAQPGEARQADAPAAADGVLGWARGRLLVAPRAGLSDAEFGRALQAVTARSKGRFARTNTHVVELPPGLDEVRAMQILKRDRRLKYVELDMAVAPSLTVSDPQYASSWALPKIQAPVAWDYANGSGVTIAILDTGVDGTHPDLAANLVPGWNAYDNNADTADVHGHGTSVAGAAAAVGNNEAGSAGVAWRASIMPVRISGLDGWAYFSTIAQGLTWAADNGARVANISYGVSGSASVQSAANYLRGKGGVVVVAAGNSGVEEAIAAHDSMLSISATGSTDVRASWSSYGNYVDLAAPGVSIYAPTRGGGYANVSGTSFASPITAGAVALLFAANPNLTPGDVDGLLKATAVDLGDAGFDIFYGAGRLDVGRAVVAAQAWAAPDTEAPTVRIVSPTGGSVSGVVPVDIDYADNSGVVRADLYVDGVLVAGDDTAPFAFAWDTAGYAAGSHVLTVKAHDAAGNVGASAGVTVSLGGDATPPVISQFTLVDGMTISPAKQAIKVTASDNVGVARIVLVIDGKQAAATTGSPSLSYNWGTRKLSLGAHTVSVRVTDAAGNLATRTVTVYR